MFNGVMMMTLEVSRRRESELFADDVGVTDLKIEKLNVVSFGSGDIFPIHGLTIPFRQIVRLTLSTCRILNGLQQ